MYLNEFLSFYRCTIKKFSKTNSFYFVRNSRNSKLATNRIEYIFIEYLHALNRSSCCNSRTSHFPHCGKITMSPVISGSRIPFAFVYIANPLEWGKGRDHTNGVVAPAVKSYTGTLWLTINNSRQRHHRAGYNFVRNTSSARRVTPRISLSVTRNCKIKISKKSQISCNKPTPRHPLKTTGLVHRWNKREQKQRFVAVICYDVGFKLYLWE